MFTPSIFGESLFDDWMDDFEKEFDKELRPAKNPLYGKHAKNMMRQMSVRQMIPMKLILTYLDSRKTKSMHSCMMDTLRYPLRRVWIRTRRTRRPASISAVSVMQAA